MTASEFVQGVIIEMLRRARPYIMAAAIIFVAGVLVGMAI